MGLGCAMLTWPYLLLGLGLGSGLGSGFSMCAMLTWPYLLLSRVKSTITFWLCLHTPG